MTTIVVAPDSFKGSLPARAVARRIRAGWLSVRPEDRIVLRPMADGGEGTLDALERIPGRSTRRVRILVEGADGRPRPCSYLVTGTGTGTGTDSGPRTAIIELASVCGIETLDGALRPWTADSRGFGQAIAHALDHGATRLILGIGSSASVDGGVGLLLALGARFHDSQGRPVARGARGLVSVASVDLSDVRSLPCDGVTVLTDVRNPLAGTLGAARTFGMQKGFRRAELQVIDDGLSNLASLLGADPTAAGCGAAGGVGYALHVWGARLTRGADTIAALLGLPDDLAGASLLITGEGSFDSQSGFGKAPSHLAALAKSLDVPVALIAGQIRAGASTRDFLMTRSLTDMTGDPSTAVRHAGSLLRRGAADFASSFQ